MTGISILDGEIGPGLCEYLLACQPGVKPALCGGWEELRESGTKLALVGAGFWDDAQAEAAEAAGIFVIRLDEEHLSPYQPADALMKAVCKLALDRQMYLPGALRALYGERRIIAVCSPHSYDMQTAFAVAYGLIQAESRRVLYLDFTYYSGFFEADGDDVGDLFYEMHKQDAPLGSILAAIVQKFGRLDYVKPARVQMDLEDITGEDLRLLLRRLLQESEYDLAVLNLPARPAFLRAAYDSCSRMYSLQREGTLYDQAQARLLEDLRLGSGETELANLKVIPMPAIGGSFSMDESMYETLLFGDMANFIRNIIEKEE